MPGFGRASAGARHPDALSEASSSLDKWWPHRRAFHPLLCESPAFLWGLECVFGKSGTRQGTGRPLGVVAPPAFYASMSQIFKKFLECGSRKSFKDSLCLAAEHWIEACRGLFYELNVLHPTLKWKTLSVLVRRALGTSSRPLQCFSSPGSYFILNYDVDL